MDGANPVLVEVVRGALVESRHRGAAAVVDADGELKAAWGEVGRAVYPRSAAKPVQALPLLETGAAERFQMTEKELALACASHSGEAIHTGAVAGWLERIGLGVGALQCGSQAPRDAETLNAMRRAGAAPSALHHNCSGKHAGFLTTAVHLGEATAGYLGPGHPVQQRVARALAEMGACDLEHGPPGVDGCGIPVFAMPLAALARAMARLAAPRGLPSARAAAARRVIAAMTAEPSLVAGRGRFDTLVMAAAAGAVAVKTGAEGVHVAALPEAGLGVALKIDDGARRAAEVAMAAILGHLGVLEGGALAALSALAEPPVLNDAGARVGTVRAAAGWLD